jgi:hypothetical protein
MRRVAGAVTVVTLVLAGTSLLNAQKQLALLATVTDPSGAESVALEAKEVHVTENGQPATVVKVEPVQRVPKLQILIDNGLGMPSESIGDLRKGVTAFLEALPNTLEVTIVTTAPQPRMLEKPTTDKIKLLQAVNRLTPDSAAGRFVESLAEAVDRIDKDKQEDASYTIFTLGTTSGDNNVRDNDLKKIMQGIQARKTTVHAAVLSRTTGGGRIQLDVGQAAADASGGRFEIINVPNRIVTLLPEYAAQIAKASGPGAKQFRITFDRPGGGTGDLGRITLAVDGKLVSGVTAERPAAARR